MPEYKSAISFYVNGTKVDCPCFVSANGQLVSAYYEIQNEDKIEILPYYTLEQVLDFMDIAAEGKYLSIMFRQICRQRYMRISR